MTRLFLAGALALLSLPIHAQAGLRLHAAVTPDAPGDTTGLRRAPLAAAGGGPVHVGAAVLEIPLGAIQTVGLEADDDGTAAVSVWLDAGTAAALARVTEAAAGRALAVLHAGRVVGAPRVEGAVPNGLVLLPGLEPGAAARLTAALRGETAPVESASEAPATWGGRSPAAVERPPLAVPPPAAVSVASSGASAGGAAEAAALGFVRAVAAREWGAAADALHPDALAALRPDALGVLRLDGATVWVRDGIQEASFPAGEALGRSPASLGALSDRDLAALHFAGLDALGVWGPPEPGRAVVGRVDEGDRAHVVLRGAAPAGGMSALSVVTVRRDAAGRWRVLLTDARGF